MITLAHLFSPESVLRCSASLVAAELGALRRRPILGPEVASWTADTRLALEGTAERTAIEARLAEFFGVTVAISGTRVGDWAAAVSDALQGPAQLLTVRTSGSSGEPKRCSHDAADLRVEHDAVLPLFPDAKRVLSMVPPHHMFGITYAVFIPERLGVPALDVRGLAPSRLASTLAPGDVLIAVPAHWQMLSRLSALPPGVHGVSATAPMPLELSEGLRARGLARMTEIYGSSENGSIGWRQDMSQPFRLFSHFRRVRAGLVRETAEGATRPVEIQDKLVWYGSERLLPAGRIDEAVQVGGVNVYPRQVADVLREHPDVEDCAVRVSGRSGAASRLEAFVVTRREGSELARELVALCASRLPQEARPRAFTFGLMLPRNEMGKLAAW